MIKNIIYFFCSLLLFFVGIILYGIILNTGNITLVEAKKQKNIDEINEVRLVIDRKNYKLHLYSNNILIKTYKVVFGIKGKSNKFSNYNFSTPIGDYNICEIVKDHKYEIFLKINYPNHQDLSEAYKNNDITKNEYEKYNKILNDGNCNANSEIFNKEIGIQGIGKYDFIFRNLPFVFNWTNGSAAVSNSEIKELAEVVKIGTPVIIKYEKD